MLIYFPEKVQSNSNQLHHILLNEPPISALFDKSAVPVLRPRTPFENLTVEEEEEEEEAALFS